MSTATYRFSRIMRGAYALCATSFLFFLLYSAPHRVHHVFEQIEAANHRAAHGHHDESKPRNNSANESDCVFQAAANRCAIGPMAQIQPLTVIQFVQHLFVSKETPHLRQFLSAAFPIRAPPTA